MLEQVHLRGWALRAQSLNGPTPFIIFLITLEKSLSDPGSLQCNHPTTLVPAALSKLSSIDCLRIFFSAELIFFFMTSLNHKYVKLEAQIRQLPLQTTLSTVTVH